MNDIQSNYPRSSPHTVSFENIASLHRSALIGQISLVIFWIVMTTLILVPKLINVERDVSLLEVILILLLCGSAIGSIWAVMVWVTRAHRAVCSLRGISPRVSSKLIGFASGIPYLLFFAPLCYALDFLAVRSESLDKPTMRWYSMASKSPLVNVFAFSIIIDCGLLLYEIVIPSKSDNIEPLDIVSTCVLLIAIVSGTIVSKRVNRNIEALMNQ